MQRESLSAGSLKGRRKSDGEDRQALHGRTDHRDPEGSRGLQERARWRGDAGIALERGVLALFLAGMPVIYLARWLMFRPADTQPAWLTVELVGLGIFGLLAVIGLKRSPWFLVVGIAGHGIAWDIPHLTSAYIPSWYAIMCMLVDVGLGLYTAARIPAWRRAAVRAAAR